MATEPSQMPRELRVALLWRFLLAFAAILAPIAAYVVTTLVVEGHGKPEYFDAVSQILPVLLLALAVEQRYFTRREPAPDSPLGEWIAVEVLATGESTSADLKNTAGSLAAGFTALIVSALVGTKQTRE